MPSVMGLLEERERAARQRVEVLQAELREAEAAWERFVIARETVGQVLAEPGDRRPAPVAVTEDRPVTVAGAVRGSMVPVWLAGLEAAVLAPDYRRIMDILAGRDGEAMDCRQLAVALGLQSVPAKVEGVRSKAKRLVTRGWLTEARPGMFSVPVSRGGGS
ncbi:hypothetical protein [Streptomyces griseorubiginosus]|uniref:hypothetical protein n=1 Tax=Streptomyces griseorubiginosus TaxID=67304 RepID=UPI002E81CFCC|nr:hypothetical protein [Streptomyces griseorubiginosus]WUB50303.1 hypothetical protein OHN19_43555 [Streptomyces griseorubiginosus]